MNGSHDTRGSVASGVEESGKACQELSHVSGGFVFVTERVHSLETGMVIHDDQSVASSPVY
eukprot:544390-Pleurochrysis_carterae.AAC.1